MSVRPAFPPHSFRLWRACTDFSWEREPALTRELCAMIERAEDITLATIKRHCAGLDLWAIQHGYGRHLPMDKDWGLRFQKSTFNGHTVYIVQWSRIEFIWAPKAALASGSITRTAAA